MYFFTVTIHHIYALLSKQTVHKYIFSHLVCRFVASNKVEMLCNELKCLKVVFRQFVQQLLDLEHTFCLILDMISSNH